MAKSVVMTVNGNDARIAEWTCLVPLNLVQMKTVEQAIWFSELAANDLSSIPGTQVVERELI